MKTIKTNERGRRIGDSHPRAVLSDHEVELLLDLLDDRRTIIDRMQAGGATQTAIDAMLTFKGLSYRLLAETFEISKGHVGKIARGVGRQQTPIIKACP